MSTETVPELSLDVTRLAQARKRYAEKKAALDKARAEWEALNKPLIDELSLAKTEQDQAEETLRTAVLAVFEKTQDRHPHPAVEVKVSTEFPFVVEEAREWALKNCPRLLELNEKGYEKLCREINASQTLYMLFRPMPYSVEGKAKPFIKSDLTSFLPPIEAKQEA